MSTANDAQSAIRNPAAFERPSAREIGALPLSVVFERLEPERRDETLALVEWLASPKERRTTGSIIEELCGRIIAAGVPLDRYGSSSSMITADHDAIGRIWRRGRGVEEVVYVSPEELDPAYLASPFFAATESGGWLELWLPDTPDERFGVVADLKAAGLTHYICAPMQMTNGANGWFTFATKAATGFDEQDLMTIAAVLPMLMMRIDARVGWGTLDKLLRTYVGDEPHHAILAGRAKRGQVTAITAAMLVADLRDSTGHVAALGPIEAVGLFNDLFDCLVPGIEAHRGGVLKYLGDGLLAIFREEYMGPPAADRALEAADAALAAVKVANAARPGRRPMEIGIALHYGEVAYGNIGSGSRLDFTVVGRDVALATRLAGFNASLARPLLLSASFAERLSCPVTPLGCFPARGFTEPLAVFEPGSDQVSP